MEREWFPRPVDRGKRKIRLGKGHFQGGLAGGDGERIAGDAFLRAASFFRPAGAWEKRKHPVQPDVVRLVFTGSV